MMSRRYPGALRQDLVTALADRHLCARSNQPASLVEGHDDHRGSVAANLLRMCNEASSPSFRLMEFTTALPCTHLSPASITVHLDESIMIGTRAISGSGGNQIQEANHRRFRVQHALIHVRRR